MSIYIYYCLTVNDPYMLIWLDFWKWTRYSKMEMDDPIEHIHMGCSASINVAASWHEHTTHMFIVENVY
jgi:hypothetical protein